ncbi:alpha/beta hydrolase [Rhodococcus sp. LB1]|uniref:alpha/beta hydrolase n=1 Tax=Rhodococcus sp. LB1 TaxID=1807499 RepID=UPI00077A0723|nr:alpha/beta hydrolase [Rhodococcus sp. LB1]KXX55476.1 hypothetical protein AZG88_18925 [Rhodococcus sp. LB1]
MTESKKTGSNRHVETYDSGYDGEIRSVRVPALALEIAANLLLPTGFDESKKYAAVVCGPPIGSCKEQTAGNIYGAALAKEGYVAIAFDASFQGESGGQPRFIELYEATLYYRTPRGAQPNGCTRALFSYPSKAVGWDAFNRAETLLTQPLLVAIGDVPGSFGAYRDGREIYGRAASKDKELVEIAGGTHYDLYDEKEAVTQILDRAIPFLAKHV